MSQSTSGIRILRQLLISQGVVAIYLLVGGAERHLGTLWDKLSEGRGQDYFLSHLSITGIVLLLAAWSLACFRQGNEGRGSMRRIALGLIGNLSLFYFGALNVAFGFSALWYGQEAEKLLSLLIAPGATLVWHYFLNLVDDEVPHDLESPDQEEAGEPENRFGWLIWHSAKMEKIKLKGTWVGISFTILIVLPVMIVGYAHYDLLMDALVRNEGMPLEQLLAFIFRIGRFILILLGVFVAFGLLFYPLSVLFTIAKVKFIDGRQRTLSEQDEAFAQEAIQKMLDLIEESGQSLGGQRRARLSLYAMTAISGFFFLEIFAFDVVHSIIRVMLGEGEGVLLWHDGFGAGSLMLLGLAFAPLFLTGHFLKDKSPARAVEKFVFSMSDGHGTTTVTENKKLMGRLVRAIRKRTIDTSEPFDPKAFILAQFGWKTLVIELLVFSYILVAPIVYYLDRRDHDLFTDSFVEVADYWTGEVTRSQYGDLRSVQIGCDLDNDKDPAMSYRLNIDEARYLDLRDIGWALRNIDSLELIDRKIVDAGVPFFPLTTEGEEGQPSLKKACLRKIERKFEHKPEEVKRLFVLLRTDVFSDHYRRN